jgi:glutamine amidotransferase
MTVTLIDSPVANVANIARALRAAGAELLVTSDAAEIARARKLVLPGVGSFVAAMRWLEESGNDRAIVQAVDAGASLLGICVGHQLLFESSTEFGTTRGLGLIRGAVEKFDGPLPVPQIGWNRVSFRGAPGETPDACGRDARRPESDDVQAFRTAGVSPAAATRFAATPDDAPGAATPLFEGIDDATPFYFVNSYAARGAAGEIASADYNGRFTAAVQRGRVCGVQFHPEKSSAAGLRVLRNFVAWN